ncbi:phage minor tail protein G [Salmonella enterica subsp. enterica]|nr:phage minor tail protein G [Salmonella enterica subsp. enterica]
MSIKNDGHYFCRAGGNRPDGLNEPVTSALQRVDYLKFIQQRTADYDAQPETLTEAERQTEFMQMGVDINAWLVSRSLCESKKEEEARALYESVRLEWSYEALGRGADMVLSLSGMRLPASQEDDSGSEKDTTTPEKS